MKLVIIESPLSGDVPRNERYLNACIRDSVLRSESPYASHRMLTGALDDLNQEERALGIRAGFEWRRMAEATVFYMDLGMSLGMTLGLEDAVALRSKMPNHEIVYPKLGGEWERGTDK